MWLTALIMGIAGSLHCAGMCSPLVAAATLNKPFLPAKLIYNGGRVITYGILGALAAAIGTLLDLKPFQNYLSLGLGMLLIVIGVAGITHLRIPGVHLVVGYLVNFLKRWLGATLKKKGHGVLFVTGMLNGLLPCGLTYLALVFCFTLPHWTGGFAYMVVFGVGTLPVMMGVSWLWGWLIQRFSLRLQTLTMLSLLLLGALLITRVWASIYVLPALLGSANPEVICP
jgi:sulfite exporter TauE/SafE